MKKVILVLAVLVSGLVQAQGKFEQGMGKAMQLWGENKSAEASDMFERIAAAEKTSWLPNYYAALVNTTSAFRTKDADKVNALLAKAQTALDVEMAKTPDNPELIVVQAMIHTALLASDPMKYGMSLSPKITALYAKAEVIAPENPRVVYCKAEFAIGGAKWTGANEKELCKDVEKSIDLFAKFKPETAFSPKWGLERAQEILKNCK